MKSISLFIGLSFVLSNYAQADGCKTASLVLTPSSQTASVCKGLGLQGAGQLEYCEKDGTTLLLETGFTQRLKANHDDALWFAENQKTDVANGNIEVLRFELRMGNTYSFSAVYKNLEGQVLASESCEGTFTARE